MAVCNLVTSPVGCATNAATGAAADAVAGGLASQIREGAEWMVRTTIGWWINVPSIDLGASPVGQVQALVWWVAAAVAAAGMCWQGARMAIARKPGPLVDIGRGLFQLGFWTAAGTATVALALRAGDSFAGWALDQGAQGQATERLAALAGLQQVTAPGAVIVLGLVMILLSGLQAVLMILREGSLVVLAGMIPLAAAGGFTQSTRPWFARLAAWMLALICYKPAAAVIYATALKMVGEGRDVRTVFVGLTMLGLSVFVLPVLLRWFSWAVPRYGNASGGLAIAGGFAANMVENRMLLNVSSGGRYGAVEHGQHLRDTLGPPGGTPPTSGSPGGGGGSGGGGPGGAVPGGGPPGPAPMAPTSGGGASGGAAGTGGSGAAGGAAAGGGGAAAAGPAGVAVAAAGAAKAGVKRAVGAAGDTMTGPGQ